PRLALRRLATLDQPTRADGMAVDESQHVKGGRILVVALDVRGDLLLLDEDHLPDRQGGVQITGGLHRLDLDLRLRLGCHGPLSTSNFAPGPTLPSPKRGEGSIPNASSRRREGSPLGGRPSESSSHRTASSSSLPQPISSGRMRRRRSARACRRACKSSSGRGAYPPRTRASTTRAKAAARAS